MLLLVLGLEQRGIAGAELLDLLGRLLPHVVDRAGGDVEVRKLLEQEGQDVGVILLDCQQQQTRVINHGKLVVKGRITHSARISELVTNGISREKPILFWIVIFKRF